MESRIFVQTARQNGRTQVEDMYFTAPYKICLLYTSDAADD